MKQRIGILYLYHLVTPLNDEHWRHPRHYSGFCELGNLAERDRRHRAGTRWEHTQNGELVCTGASRFLQVAGERGIGFHLVRAWRGTRSDERRLKRQGHAPDMCPVCCAQMGRRPRQVTFLDEIGVDVALATRNTRR